MLEVADQARAGKCAGSKGRLLYIRHDFRINLACTVDFEDVYDSNGTAVAKPLPVLDLRLSEFLS